MILRHSSPLRLRRTGLPAAATVMTLLTVALAVTARPAQAQDYNVSLDTSQLTPGDQYAVDLQLLQGTSTPAGAPTSLVNVSSFLFGTGSPGTIDYGGGGASDGSGSTGDFSQTVTLDNGQSPFAEFTQQFSGGGTTGSLVSFNVDASALYAPASAGSGPDQFSFDLIDDTTNSQVQTDAPGGANSLFTLTNDPLTGYNPMAYSYIGMDDSTNPTQYSASQPAATPELGTGISLGVLLGLFGLGALRARRGHPTPSTLFRKLP